MGKKIFKIISSVVIIVFLIYLLPRDNRIMVPEGSADISIEQVVQNALRNSLGTSTPLLVCNNGVCMPKGTTMADLEVERQNLIAAQIAAQTQNGSSTLKLPRAKELVSPTGFINTEPFKIADLVGKKVILVEFWTYSCINCQHVISYLNDWYAKYKDKGLEIVSIHSPEFEYEKNRENVENAVTKFGIKYPVVMDNQFGTWNAYKNRFWPRMYLIDLKGNIVGDHIGAGNYEEIEEKIKELLGL